METYRTESARETEKQARSALAASSSLTRLDVFYLMAAVVGTIGPWVFFGRYLAGGGALVGFVGDIFSNDLGAGAWVDLLVSGTVFMVWSFVDSRRRNLSGWWIHVVALWTVGLSLALPLYLFRRGGTGS